MKAKIKNLKLVYILLILLLSGIYTHAQQGPKNVGKNYNENKERGCMAFLPDLREDQKEKITALRTNHQKEMIQFHTDMQEKHAKLNKLQTADNPEINAINTLIDDISKTKAEMMKKSAAHRQSVRAILSEEQRVIFDQKFLNKGNRMCYGYGRGYRHGPAHGQGYGPHGNYPNCPMKN